MANGCTATGAVTTIEVFHFPFRLTFLIAVSTCKDDGANGF